MKPFVSETPNVGSAELNPTNRPSGVIDERKLLPSKTPLSPTVLIPSVVWFPRSRTNTSTPS